MGFCGNTLPQFPGVSLRRVRFKDNADGAPTFAPSDIIMVNDGGRGGQHMLFFKSI